MTDTVRTIPDLLNRLRDGQAAESIPPQTLRDLLVSLDNGLNPVRSGLVGTAIPNPGVQRVLGFPKVMANPPAVTQGVQDAATTIAGGVFTPVTVDSGGGVYVLNPAAPWRYLGGNVVLRGPTYPNYLFVTPENVQPNVNTGNMALEFEFDGAKFDFWIKGVGNAQWYRILVDGELVSRYGQAGPASTGSGYFILVNFGARAKRRVRIEFSQAGHLGGITVGPNDTLWRTSRPRGPKVIVVGDSFSEGANANSSLSTWADTMGKLLGWSDVQLSGLGATGYLQGITFRSRLAADVIPYAPDIVVFAGGINDTAFTQAQIQTEVTALIAQLRASLPDVRLIFVGPFWPTGAPTAQVIAVNAGVSAAAATDVGPHLFFSTLGDITGTGRVGAETGAGNADLYTSNDTTHPTQDGHDYRGYRAAQRIAEGMPF